MLWLTHYQILSIKWLKEFIKLNIEMIIKNVNSEELNANIAIPVLNTEMLNMI